MNLRRRLEALERRLITEPARLTMPGGDAVAIPGRGDRLLKLLAVAVSGENGSPEQWKQLDFDSPMRGCRRAGRRAHGGVHPVLPAWSGKRGRSQQSRPCAWTAK